MPRWARRALWLVAAAPVAYAAFAAAYFLYSYPPAGVLSFGADFESGDLRAFDRPGMRQTCCEHSAQVVSAPVREGRHALRMRLDSDDPLMRGNHRAEMRFRSTRPGSNNEYAFSVFVPTDWQDDSLDTIVAQWHAVPDRWRGETYAPSPLHLALSDGRWEISVAWDDRAVIRYPFRRGMPRGFAVPLSVPAEKGRWVDWTFRVRWACDASGLLVVTRDGVEVLRRAGPNSYDDAIGPYMKFGLYRFASRGRQPEASRTIYFDAIRLRQGEP